MKRITFAALFLGASLVPAFAAAADAVEKYAEAAAVGANNSYKRGIPNDGVTRSARAYAQGNVLVHEYVLAIRADATEKELAAWRAGTRSEIFPGVCSAMKGDEYFQRRGFQIRYRYLNQSDKVLDEFQVNKPSCKAYGL